MHQIYILISISVCDMAKRSCQLNLPAKIDNLKNDDYLQFPKTDIFLFLSSKTLYSVLKIIIIYILQIYNNKLILKQGSKIIYIVRNPLSVALSWFHHIKRIPHHSYDGTANIFIESFAEELCM